MTISRKAVISSTIALLTVSLISLICIMATAIWLGEREKSYSGDAFEAREVRIAAVELRSALQTAESSQRGFLLGGNEIYLAPYDSAKAKATAQFERLRASADNQQVLQRLSQLISEKFDEMDRTIANKRVSPGADLQSILGTNRGKAIMDETNLFLSSIIRKADEKLTAGVLEQGRNTVRLRWVSILGGLAIILLVGAVVSTIYRYSQEISQTRDRLKVLSNDLEQRVLDRTVDLAAARDKAEVLLAEVNHRVANSLAMVSSLVRLQSGTMQDKISRDALNEVQARINAISTVHKHLYVSGDARFVDVDEYIAVLLDNVEKSMRAQGKGISLRYNLDAMKLKTDSSINLGVIVTEWVTNAFKYAYPDSSGEVRVSLKKLSDLRAELIVEDDGVGSHKGGTPQGTGLGTRIVNAMAHTLGAEVEYFARDPGFGARAAFTFSSEIG